MLLTKQVATDFHSMEKNKLWKSMTTINCLVTNVLQNILFNHGSRCLLWYGEKNQINYGSQWLLSTFWLPTFFKISSFVFNWRKKLIQVWLNSRVSKWWQKYHFWVNYPFKTSLRWFDYLSWQGLIVLVEFWVLAGEDRTPTNHFLVFQQVTNLIKHNKKRLWLVRFSFKTKQEVIKA